MTVSHVSTKRPHGLRSLGGPAAALRPRHPRRLCGNVERPSWHRHDPGLHGGQRLGQIMGAFKSISTTGTSAVCGGTGGRALRGDCGRAITSSMSSATKLRSDVFANILPSILFAGRMTRSARHRTARRSAGIDTHPRHEGCDYRGMRREGDGIRYDDVGGTSRPPNISPVEDDATTAAWTL